MVRHAKYTFEALAGNQLQLASDNGTVLREAVHPKDGRTFVKARPEGQGFALRFTNRSSDMVCVKFCVDDQHCLASLPCVKPQEHKTVRGWELDAATSGTKDDANIKPFEFSVADMGGRNENGGASEVPAGLSTFKCTVFEVRACAPKVANYQITHGAPKASLAYGKAAKINGASASAPKKHEVVAKTAQKMQTVEAGAVLAEMVIHFRSSLGLLHEGVKVEDAEQPGLPGSLVVGGEGGDDSGSDSDVQESAPPAGKKRQRKGAPPPTQSPASKAPKKAKHERTKGTGGGSGGFIDLT